MKQRCNAKSKGTGEQCKLAAMLNGKCRFHGGKQPRGPANANWKHGRYSKAMPKRLAEAFAEFMADTQRTESAAEIAAVSLRVDELVANLDSGGVAAASLPKAVDDVDAAARSGDADGFRGAMVRLRELTDRAVAVERTWNAILQAIEQRRKLVDTELRREQRAYETVTPAELATFVAALTEIVTRYVPDRKRLAALTQEIDTRLLH